MSYKCKVLSVGKKKGPFIIHDIDCVFCSWILFMVGSHFGLLFERTCLWLAASLGYSEPAVTLLNAASRLLVPVCTGLHSVTGREGEGNAIFIQSVFRMSWGRNTSPAQSSPTVIPIFPRSYHLCHKTTTPSLLLFPG